MKKITRESATPSKSRQKDSGTVEHYNAILLEDIRSKMELVMEKVDSSEERLGRRIDEFKTEVRERFERVELAITHHSGEIKGLKTEVMGLKTEMTGVKADVTGLKTEMTSMRSEMAAMEHRLSDKIDGIKKQVGNHEERITVLEADRL